MHAHTRAVIVITWLADSATIGLLAHLSFIWWASVPGRSGCPTLIHTLAAHSLTPSPHWGLGTLSSPHGPHPVFTPCPHYAGSPRLERLMASHGEGFEPSKFVTICSQVQVSGSVGGSNVWEVWGSVGGTYGRQVQGGYPMPAFNNAFMQLMGNA